MEVIVIPGASISRAEHVKQLVEQLSSQAENKRIVLCSSLSDTQTRLALLVSHFFENNSDLAHQELEAIRNFHISLAKELFAEHPTLLVDSLSNLLVEIEWILEDGPVDAYEYTYDQIIAVGPLLASTLISHYLLVNGFKNDWVDARNLIHTDNQYGAAEIERAKTEQAIDSTLSPLLEQGWVITQSGIGTTSENFSTTLGENADALTAGVVASALSAQQVSLEL